jgi:hypothetical protein
MVATAKEIMLAMLFLQTKTMTVNVFSCICAPVATKRMIKFCMSAQTPITKKFTAAVVVIGQKNHVQMEEIKRHAEVDE